MNKVGIVIDHKKMKRLMPYYIDANTARSKRVVSTVLFVEVTAAEAQAFNHYWKHLSQLPSSFHIIGKNCSSHASRAFVKSGILGGGIPGLDTPNNLYNQLAQLKNRKVRSITGYIGHIPGKHSGYLDLVIHKLQ